MPRGAQRLLAGVVSAALALLAAEGLLRTASARWLHVLDVEMWRYARAVKRPAPAPEMEDHRPGADAVLMGVRVRTDEHGFRRSDPATEARRRPGDRLVAALGDSLTLGWGVAAGETWPAHLERLLRARCPGRPATVLNAGIGNSNTALQVARYERRVRPLAPEWVVVGWFVNDAEPAPVPADNPLLWRSALAGLVSTRLRQGAEVRLRDYRAYYGGLHDERRAGWRAMRAALRELGADLAADGAAATLVLLPELHAPRGFGPFAAVYARVAAEAKGAGFEVIDPSRAFPPGPGEGYWVSPTDTHPNAAAQRRFAAAVAGSRFACGAERDGRPVKPAAAASR